jgi:tRNA threonylcarbamoyladenosine biosynthesis protein TsaB
VVNASPASLSPARGLCLALDAAASLGTIAVLRDGVTIAERVVEMKSNADERFFPAILDTLHDAGATPRQLDGVVCGAGPGSFTSLRVVGAIAKGLVVGGGLPLFAVPSLALIVAADATTTGAGRWLATLDAMRGDRYLALVTTAQDGSIERVESLGLAPGDHIAARAAELGAIAIGPDEPHRAMPHARGVARALALVAAAGTVDVASWEPVYGRLAEAQVKWEAAHGRALVAERYAS